MIISFLSIQIIFSESVSDSVVNCCRSPCVEALWDLWISCWFDDTDGWRKGLSNWPGRFRKSQEPFHRESTFLFEYVFSKLHCICMSQQEVHYFQQRFRWKEFWNQKVVFWNNIFSRIIRVFYWMLSIFARIYCQIWRAQSKFEYFHHSWNFTASESRHLGCISKWNFLTIYWNSNARLLPEFQCIKTIKTLSSASKLEITLVDVHINVEV